MFHEHEPKDDSRAVEYRTEGNKMFKDSKFFESLEFYNKSLCFASTRSQNIALAYGNRSAVYFELKDFGKCLENTKLACDAGYPTEKLGRLMERKRRCVESMKQQQASDDDDPWNFFKLTYPPNKKYPAIAGCLELHKNEKYGRHIIANRDLMPGDIIAIEETPFNGLTVEGSYIHCANCLKSNKMSLIPIETCARAMFCSQQCLEYGKDKYMWATDEKFSFIRIILQALDIVGGDLNKLELLMTDPELRSKTAFDLDLSNPHDSSFKYNQLLAFNSLAEYQQRFDTEFMFRYLPMAIKTRERYRRKLRGSCLRSTQKWAKNKPRSFYLSIRFLLQPLLLSKY